MTAMTPCGICGEATLREHIDVGEHPVASFFLERADAPERPARLALGQCETCGTIQSTAVVPHTALIPPYDWLPAREPEEHLDAVVERILGLDGVGTDLVIGALTYKDDTTVERFRRKGFVRTWRIDLAEDLGVADPRASIETVQALTEPGRMAAIAGRHGAADILIVRHILEHAEDLSRFMAGLAELVRPGGLLMLEVPDCSTSLAHNDYCMIWEEHSFYFTPETFGQVLHLGGFELVDLHVYPLPFENSMVLLARRTAASGAFEPALEAQAQQGLLERYAQAFDPARRELRETLEEVRRTRGPIALFGAGHLAHAFTNFMGVADLVDFVADDTPMKQGKFLPGARLPILPSGELVSRGIRLCLLALSINNENAVIGRNSAFVKGGGEFRSIFRTSPRSIFRRP